MPTQCPGIHASECRTGLCQGQMHGNWSDPVSHRSWCHPPGIPQVRHRLQNLQIPPLLLQGPGPWRWKEGDWARTFWCRALVSSPCAHWGSTGGPRAPLPGNRNPRSCLVLSRGPSLDSPARYTWCPLLPWGPEPGNGWGCVSQGLPRCLPTPKA